eukprot:1667685-Rhodomonas_salina.1
MFGGGVWPELQEHYADGGGARNGVSFVPHVSPVNSEASVVSNGEDAQLLPDSGSASMQHPSHDFPARQPVLAGNHPRVPIPSPSGEARQVIHGDPSCTIAGHDEGKFPVGIRSEGQCRNSFMLKDGSTLAMLDGMPDGSITSIMTVKEEVGRWADNLGWNLQLWFLAHCSTKTGTLFLIRCDSNGKARSRAAASLPGELADGQRNVNGKLLHSRPNAKNKACDCKFRLTFEFSSDNTWVMTSAFTNHNHDPVVKNPCAGVRVNTSFWYADTTSVPADVQPFMDWLVAIGVKGTMLTSHLQKACLTKGIIPTFTSQSLRNQTRVPVGQIDLDATNLSEWISKRRTDHGLYGDIYALNGFLEHSFFVFKGARELWNRQGGGWCTLIVDTTHIKMCYNLKLLLFVSMDREGNSRILAAGLLSNEFAESFKWVFHQFNTALGLSPDIILSNQCASIRKAVLSVWQALEDLHFLCTFHLFNNFREALMRFMVPLEGTLWETTQNAFWRFAKNADSRGVERFDAEWNVFTTSIRSALLRDDGTHSEGAAKALTILDRLYSNRK